MTLMAFLGDILLSCVITFGWCLMFNLPMRYVGMCLLMTALGFGSKTLMADFGVQLAVATFFWGDVF